MTKLKSEQFRFSVLTQCIASLRIAFFIIFLFFSIHPSTNAASFKLNPSTGAYGQGCNASVDIILDTEGSTTNAADIIIDYDPAKVDIVDSDGGTAGVQISPGTIFTDYFGNTVDTSTGVIRLTGASFSSVFNSSGIFASIQFRPKTNTGTAYFTIRFTGANPYNTLDSNIANSSTSNDLLSSVVNGAYTLNSTSCVSDTTAPVISFDTPQNGQTGIPADANIVVTITDESSGVSISTVEIIINGVTYKSGQTGVVVTGNASAYTFTVTPTTLLRANDTNTVLVNATDFAGNWKQASITFNAPGTTPTVTPTTTITPTPSGPTPTVNPYCPAAPTCPVCPTVPQTTPACPNLTPTPIPNIVDDKKSPFIEFIKPQSKDVIDYTPTILLKVSDYDSGIDLNSLKITLNDQIYNINSTGLTYKGDLHSYDLTLKISDPLPDSSEYALTVFIADQNKNGLSQTIYVKTKTPILNQVSNFFNQIPLVGQQSTTGQSPTVTFAQVARGTLLLLLFSLIPFIIFLLYRLFRLLSQTQTTPIGYVFNSSTHEPLKDVSVEIYNHLNRKIATLRTNIYGIFTGNLLPGKYRFLIQYPGFAFPSETDFARLDYPHLYHGEIIEFKQDNPLYLSIPLDPKSHPNYHYYPAFIQKLLLAFNLILPPPGLITDSHGTPQPDIELGLIETKFNSLVATRITDQSGHYRFIVSPGRYQLVYKNKKLGRPIDTRHLTSGYTIVNGDYQI